MKIINFKHLSQVEETYSQHWKFSVWAGIFLCYLGLLSLIHGFFPFLFSRYPDYIFRNFLEKSKNRRTKVDSLLKQKGLE
jgi:hypothetical protein